MRDFVIKQNQNVTIFVDKRENSAVLYAVNKLMEDISKVFHVTAKIADSKEVANIVIATEDIYPLPFHEILFDKNGELHWEAYFQYVENGVLYICGADKRGTVFGIYELCEMMGVSPWYFFADVPIKKKNSFCLENGYQKLDFPSVRYRGIFINDEEELEAWAIFHMEEKTIGPKTYEHIFEFLLRLKANYIWPAMHVNAFNMDERNGKLAHSMGLVVGTSHCDMLLRSNQNEWNPWLEKKGYENVEYDYSIEGTNKDIIKEYWRESVEQNKEYDVCYTVGMRGIHDSGFITKEITGDYSLTEEEKKQKKVKLLEQVIDDQRLIIKDVTGKENTLQTFIPYKEVLNLYDEGLQVPEDITMVWVNDNFGYMRRYPNEKEQKRSGGHGLYYHASYWAHPGMSYLFFNSTPLAHMKNELKKAYENGIQKLWVLNAGAVKPLEIDIEFFIRYAWEINNKEKQTKDVIDFLTLWIERNFSIENGRKAAETYHAFLQITNVRKVEHMKSDVFGQEVFGNEAAKRMQKYQEMFHDTVQIHKSLSKDEQDAFFEMYAMKIYAAYFINASFYYGDRSRMMYQKDCMEKAELYTLYSRKMDWFKRRLLYYYNEKMQGGKWNKILTPESFLPPCTALFPACKPALMIEKEKLECKAEVDAIEEKALHAGKGFVERDGYISMQASHYSKNTGWNCIPLCGYYEGDLMEAGNGCLEYEIYVTSSGEFLLEIYRFPTLNSTGRIRIGISVDDGTIEYMESYANDEWRDCWKQNVMNNVEKMYFTLPYMKVGKHILRVHSVDQYTAFSKIVIYTKEYIKSKLGPEESFHSQFNPEPMKAQYRFEPDMNCLNQICDDLFTDDDIPLPDVIYADKEFWKKERLYLKNVVRHQKCLGKPKYVAKADGTKDVFSSFGIGVFKEEKGAFAFGTEYVLEQSENAWMEADGHGIQWEHTHSETNGGTGIAMYIPNENLFWESNMQAPSLNYRMECTGGKYNVWLLLKYDDEPNARIGIGIDGMEIPQEKIYNNGFLFNYGTQQNWVWMILTEVEIESGIHTFSLYAKASEIRIDRIYITKGEEYPPIDSEWLEAERN